MKNFKVGDKVVAIKSSGSDSLQTYKKGKLYTIGAAMFCSNCGDQKVNIGQSTEERDVICSSCRALAKTGGLAWTTHKAFIKLDDVSDELQMAVEEEDYELAALLRDLELELCQD